MPRPAEPLDWFFKSGILELGDKLGPVLWQFAPFKKFDREDLAGFLKLLPREANGRPLMHVVEVRHESFLVPEFVALLRDHNVAVVYADSDDYPALADVTADFVYARLQRTEEANDTGYSAADLDQWAKRARLWRVGRHAGGFDAHREKIRGEEEAAGLRLHDQRRQGPCARRRHGADRAARIGPGGCASRAPGGGTPLLSRESPITLSDLVFSKVIPGPH